jgi:hypothetical protein
MSEGFGPTTSGAIRCTCGVDRGDGSKLPRVGWASDFCGGAILLVRCAACHTTPTVARVIDASFCEDCGRMLCDEVKVCAESRGVLCIPCARGAGLVTAQ